MQLNTQIQLSQDEEHRDKLTPKTFLISVYRYDKNKLGLRVN